MWFIVALIVGVLVGALVLWLRSRDIKVAWYEWLIGILGLLLLLFGIQNYFGSLAEFDGTANLYLLVVVLPGIILGAVVAALIWRRQRAAG